MLESPEELEAKRKELQNLKEIKTEERQILTDSISKKKLQIKNNEAAHELIKSLSSHFTNSNGTLKKLK